jgi:hypothetical protein
MSMTTSPEIAPPRSLNGFHTLASQVAHHACASNGGLRQWVVDLVTFPVSDDPVHTLAFLAEQCEFRCRRLSAGGVLAVPPFAPIDCADAGWPGLVEWSAVADRLMDDERSLRSGGGS